jgi:hypothetical protein
MLNRRRNLYIGILVSIAGLVWLGPVAGATFDGGDTVLVLVGRLLTYNSECRINYNYGASSMDCVYNRGYEAGVIACCLFGVVIFICIFQLVRLWVRKHHL